MPSVSKCTCLLKPTANVLIIAASRGILAKLRQHGFLISRRVVSCDYSLIDSLKACFHNAASIQITMLAPPTLAYGWVNSQSSVVAGCQRALNKFGDAARDVDTALMSVGGQKYRYDSVHVRPRGPELSRHANHEHRPSPPQLL